MALINCPECGAQVSDRANECNKCAYPINKTPKVIKVKSEEQGCFLQTLNMGCFVVFLIIAVILFLIIFAF